MAADLAGLPSVTRILQHPIVVSLIEQHSRALVVHWIRQELDRQRAQQTEHGHSLDPDQWMALVVRQLAQTAHGHGLKQIRQVINATGIILHTGLGRAPLCNAAVQAVMESCAATNVELDLTTGQRSRRGEALQPVWQMLTGCEAALVVNNNAAATLLALQGLCAGREVIISRGQLIEIGGSFRLPDIFRISGAVLREVGTTNRTKLRDYSEAITEKTAAILRVHPSNFRVRGFSETPDVRELAELARAHNVVMIDDIGSGCLLETKTHGQLFDEPSFPASIAAGADLVLGSGDKLFGGPQCGILLGRNSILQQLQDHPLARALRVDKLTLAALSATLECYARGQAEQLPVMRMLQSSVPDLLARAHRIVAAIEIPPEWYIEVREGLTEMGGGTMPDEPIQTAVIAIRHDLQSEAALSERLRSRPVPIVGRVSGGQLLLDLRSVPVAADDHLVDALKALVSDGP